MNMAVCMEGLTLHHVQAFQQGRSMHKPVDGHRVKMPVSRVGCLCDC